MTPVRDKGAPKKKSTIAKVNLPRPTYAKRTSYMNNLTEPYCYIDDLYQSFKPEFETQIIASGRRRLRACQINVAEITAFLVLNRPDFIGE